MKKIISLVALVLVGVAVYFGYNYYQSTYVSKDAYGIVPSEVPAKTTTKSLDGKNVPNSYSYLYKIKFAFEDGKTTTRNIEISSENPTPLKPNSYIKVKLSDKRTTNGPVYVNETAVPAKALAALK